MYRRGIILIFLLAVAVAQLSHKEGHCPLRNSVSRCTPRCISDYHCSSNEKCCPNKCGSESCAPASPVSTGSGYKGSSNGNVYCAGVKCGPYEKCRFDRTTKREKCMRT